MKSLNTRKLDKYAIPNLYFVILICTITGYVLRYVPFLNPLYNQLLLDPYMVVVKYQYWRLFTWIFTTPYELSPIMVLFLPINLYFYYSIGRALENLWGRFMYNLYVIGGALLIDVFVLLGAFYQYYWSPMAKIYNGLAENSAFQRTDFGVTHYMLVSIFLAFTVVGGENMVYLYFVIPLKMKWLGYIDLAFLAYSFFVSIISYMKGYLIGFFSAIVILCSVANYFIYFFVNKGKTAPTLKDRRRQKQFKNAMKRKSSSAAEYNRDGTIKFPGSSQIIPPGYGNPEGISIHKCAVCGRTEKDNPNLEFRFCSKCAGNYEYCTDHLYTHQHIG